ncbi:MAG: LPS export ABC transporter permease LptF [Candidatus Aminicenantes bacterium]|nr:MAG: LPS export ABC transporter permease LptF [Candidatus Aminicenantes bacterium]
MLKFFDRYIIRELIPPSLIGLLIYTFVLLMNHILQLAEVFITRGITLRAAIELLVFLIPSILAFTVPMSVLMGILGGLSRLSSDSEIVAFKTLGISYKRLLRPVLVYSLALLILTSFLTLYLAPRANFKWVQAFSKSVMESVQFRISPKEFNESIPHTVIFFQGMTKERVWEDVFVYLSDPDKEPIAIVAKKGRLNLYPGMKRAVLRLSDGVVHSYSPSEPEKYGVTSFENLEEEINVESLFSSVSKEKRVREKDIHELIKGVRIVKQDLASLEEESGREDRGYQRKWKEYISHWVEIHKKFAFPFVCLIFGILALPLGASTRKGGRTSGFTISLGIITIYYVLITFGEKTAMDGKLPTWLGMWGPNILLLLAALYLFFRSQKESSLFSFPSFLKREKESVSVNKKKKFSRNLPRLSLRFPNILDRYIIRKYLAIFSLVFLSLIVISVIVTFFERIDNIYEHNKPISLLLEYIRYSLPEFIHYIFPIAALTTALLSLGLLTKFNEITAMKTCGLSLYRIILPVVLLAAVVSFFSYYLQENVLPYSNKKAEEIWNRINDRPIRSYSYLDRRWVLSKEENRIYHYNYFDQEKSAFSQLSVYDLDPVSWAIQRRVYSEKAFLGEGRLSLENCWLRDFSGGKMIEFEKKENLNIDMQEDRSYFLKEWREPDQMSFGELTKYIRELDERNFDTVRFKVDLNYKISFPFVCLIMTLLGIPFAFSLGKKGTLVGIGLSLAIAIIYWGIIGIFQGLGYVSYLSAFLSAWGPNLIFGLIGLYLLFTLRA